MSPRWLTGTPTLAHLAARQHVVGVVARLRRQIEGHRQPRLPLCEVAAVKARWTSRPWNAPRRCGRSRARRERAGASGSWSATFAGAPSGGKRAGASHAAVRKNACGTRRSDDSMSHPTARSEAAPARRAHARLSHRRPRPTGRRKGPLRGGRDAPRPSTCRRRCTPGPSAANVTAAPTAPCRWRSCPPPTIGDDECLVLVMAAGVNYNGVWAALGTPVSPFDGAQAAVPHRRLRRLGRGLGGGPQGEALEAGRRGGGPLQPGRRRRRGVQRGRPDVLHQPAHLGLRDAGRLLRPVLPRAIAPADGAPQAPYLGGGGLLRADPLHRLPHAVRSPPARAAPRATTCWCGGRAGASACSPPSCAPRRAPTPSG